MSLLPLHLSGRLIIQFFLGICIRSGTCFYDIHFWTLINPTPPLHRLIARISSLAIKTGVIPCVYALISLVTYLTHVDPNIVTFITYMLGRVYTLSMLFSLIYRDKLASDNELINTRLPSCEWDRYTFLLLAHFSK